MTHDQDIAAPLPARDPHQGWQGRSADTVNPDETRAQGRGAVSNFLESLRAAVTAIFAHKLRSVLTTLGIIIAVMSVIAVVSLLQGFSWLCHLNFKGMGANGVRHI